ncbi:MAG: nuclear transport factor 2 family protein [Candidatus Pseudobacter hemicellulosilyticus]|uniref:Nuclear transport factor 2 family protein n=1 Tax=Candidatus Pseudobacter hemicellulosilyticus TaxID=3121375 RepID=A0AAJ6BEV3_9BACT|nr:MAG: nuclear transport factor 2 family protein [Pseudobacter sp.]
MKQILILLTALLAGNGLLQAQGNSTEDSVKAAVNKLFEGMKKADAALVTAAFSDSALLQTIHYNREGQTITRNLSVPAFAAMVARSEPGAADERIQFGSILVDGGLASVWTPYQFFYQGQLSHCGVNSFQLVRFKEGWKIQYIIDTRRKSPCPQQ